MSNKCKYYITNSAISLAILSAVFGISVILQEVLSVGENITLLFVFGVFMIVGIIMAATYLVGKIGKKDEDGAN